MRRSWMAPLAVFAVAAVAGGWLLQEGVNEAEHVYSKVRLLQEVLDRVESSFVDSVETGKLYDSAIEGEGDAFLRRVRDGYLELAEREANVRVVSGEGSPEEVHGRIRRLLMSELPEAFPASLAQTLGI